VKLATHADAPGDGLSRIQAAMQPISSNTTARPARVSNSAAKR